MANFVGQQLGNYRLIHLIGQGGFADVYLGEHIYLNTQAAIKLLNTRLGQEDQESFLTEARTIAHLRHLNIIKVLDFGVANNMPFLVLEYARNGTLRQRYPKGTRLSPATILPHLKQVASALQYAHNHKLIHRDVKPENMLLGYDDEVWLSDFGISLILQTSQYQSATDAGGTVWYMAPEQLRGHPRPASDQYSLGIVVYEWLAGERPFNGTFAEIASQHMFIPPPPLHTRVPNISPALEQTVMKALNKDPEQRFPDVQAFANAFEQASQPYHPPLPNNTFHEPISPPENTSQAPYAGMVRMEQTQHRSFSTGMALVLAILALLIIAASGLTYYFTGPYANQLHNQATATAQAQNTAHTNATQLVQIQETAHANATSAARAQATINAQATVNAGPQAIYTQATSGNPILNDPLRAQDQYNWDVNLSRGEGCTFTGGAYHALEPTSNTFYACFARKSSFSNLAFQVQMTILKGDAGGILFRANSSKDKFYYFRISQDGSYQLYLSVDTTGNNDKILASSPTSAIKTGLNRPNLLTIVANGQKLYLYVNKQFITSISDSNYTSGEIGVIADSDTHPTEAAFGNAQVWIL
jgi:serine/threonine protein kinase